MFLKRKSKIKKQQRPSWAETVEIMQYKGLQLADAEVVEVLFNDDKTHRCVISKSNKGFLSYSFETLEAYDEDWLQPEDTLPAYWIPNSNGMKSIFNDMEILKRELKTDSEYRIYFDKKNS